MGEAGLLLAREIGKEYQGNQLAEVTLRGVGWLIQELDSKHGEPPMIDLIGDDYGKGAKTRGMRVDNEDFKGRTADYSSDRVSIKLVKEVARKERSVEVELEDLHAEPAPVAGKVKATQTNKLRTNTLDPAIDKAIEEAGGKKCAPVYLKLRELALANELPFTGALDGDALCYTDDNNKPASLTKDALSARLKRRR